MNEYLESALNYIKKTLGSQPKIMEFNQLKRIPLFLKNMYSFYKCILFNKEFLILTPEHTEFQKPAQIKKQGDTIRQSLALPVIFIFPGLEAYNRERLIKYKISFIVPGKQMYLPYLMIDLRESFQTIKEKKDYFLPSGQLLLLYHLQKEPLNGKCQYELAEILGYSPMSIHRAVNQILTYGVGETRNGRNKPLIFTYSGKKLWDKALPFLRSPVAKVYYYTGNKKWVGFLKSNITALSFYTTIAAPERGFYACNISDYQGLVLNKIVSKYPENDKTPVIEIWNYNPELLQINECVDPLSLYLALKDTRDERIEKALEDMILEVFK